MSENTPQAQVLEGGTYEVLRNRLRKGEEHLRQRLALLNSSRSLDPSHACSTVVECVLIVILHYHPIPAAVFTTYQYLRFKSAFAPPVLK